MWHSEAEFTEMKSDFTSSEIPKKGPNAKWYFFIRQPEQIVLAHHCQTVLNCIEEFTPITRHELVIKLRGRLETVDAITRIVSAQTALLSKLGFIRIVKPDEAKIIMILKEAQLNGDTAVVARNKRGGYSIHTPPTEKGVGNYATREDALQILNINGLSEPINENKEDEKYGISQSDSERHVAW